MIVEWGDLVANGTLQHLGGGTYLRPSDNTRWHQNPDDGETLLSDKELAEAFVGANDEIFSVDQVNLDVLAALWQLESVSDIQKSKLFNGTAKAAAARSAASANKLSMVRMFITSGINKPLFRQSSREVQSQCLCFGIMPGSDGGSQAVQFALELQDPPPKTPDSPRTTPAPPDVGKFAARGAARLAAGPSAPVSSSSGQPALPSSDSLVGRVVEIRGLVSKPHLNGATGSVMNKVLETGRYAVRVTALPDGSPPGARETRILLKPENIVATDAADHIISAAASAGSVADLLDSLSLGPDLDVSSE